MINDLQEIQWAYLLDPAFELVNTAGKPLTNGWIEVYIHGTRDKYYCASDFDGTLHPFKIPLDSLGSNIILASPAHAYDIYAYNKFGSLVMSRYNVIPATGDGQVITDVVELQSSDNTVKIESNSGTNWDLSVQDTIDSAVESINDTLEVAVEPLQRQINNLDAAIAGKKDKQTTVDVSGSVTKTITRLQQDANGKVTVTYSDIDLPAEVPNVEITSEDNSVTVTETTDAETNTKTFDLSVNADNALEYGQFRATNVTSVAQLTKMKGNLELNDNHDAIKLKKGNSYHFTVRGSYIADSVANTATTISYIEDSEFTAINVNVDNTITEHQNFEISYDVYNYSLNSDYSILFASITGGKVSTLWVEVHSIAASGSSSGSTYTTGEGIDITDDTISVKYGAGLTVNASNELEIQAGQGIDITSDEISVDVGKGLGFDENDKLEVKIGTGLTYDSEDNVVTIDNDVADVVETVEKLEEDLDTQLCVNFDLANITNVYDFADGNVTGLTNGATMLCQAFAVPINHAIRVHGEDNPTMLGIYFKNTSYTTKFILALYVYNFENGYTDYVGDTGPVQIYQQGLNQFALKTKNPNIDELSSRCIYYASLYLPSIKNSGLYLAGCESYSSAGNINAIPRFTIGVENIALNNTEIDLDDEDATLSANDGQGNYYIGPWSDSYNERPSIPRFFMQIRNGEEPAIVTSDPFTNIEYQSIIRNSNAAMSDVFDTSGLASATYPMVFQAVTPVVDVDIVSWTVYDGNADDSNSFYARVYTSDFSDTVNTTATITNASGSYGYSHTVTPSTPIHLTAGTTYRWPVCLGAQNYYSALRTYDSSVTNTKVLHLFASSWDISNWVTYSRVNDGPAVALTLVDSNNNTWHI